MYVYLVYNTEDQIRYVFSSLRKAFNYVERGRSLRTFENDELVYDHVLSDMKDYDRAELYEASAYGYWVIMKEKVR